MGFFTITTVLLNLLVLVFADHYLIVMTPEKGSQTVALTSAAKAMIQRNHTVTLIAGDDFVANVKKHMRDYKYSLESFETAVKGETFQEIQSSLTGMALKGEYLKMIPTTARIPKEIFYQSCADMFKDQKLLNKLKLQKFDLILAHTLIACPVILAEYLDVPFVTFIPAIPPTTFLRLFANPINPAYTPEAITSLSNRMTFLQRVRNTIASGIQWMMVGLPYQGFDDIKQQYNIKPERPFLESMTKAELMFITGHFAFDFPRPYQPNVIDVSGLSASKPRPLPKVSYCEEMSLMLMFIAYENIN